MNRSKIVLRVLVIAPKLNKPRFISGFSFCKLRYNTYMKQSNDALTMSIMPAFFAAGCCATYPLMIIFGFAVGETVFSDYKWWFFIFGVIVLFSSLALYFYNRGVTDWNKFTTQQTKILLITAQTVLFSAAVYLFMILQVTPFLYEQIGENCEGCSLIEFIQ